VSRSDEIRARRIVRYLSLLLPFGLGIYFVTGHGFDLLGQTSGDSYLGGFLILLGVLGLLGVNVWIFGPLDKRLDSKRAQASIQSDPYVLIALVPPDVEWQDQAAAIGGTIIPGHRSRTFIHSLLNHGDTRFYAHSFVFGDIRDAWLIGEGMSLGTRSPVWLIAVAEWREIAACWKFEGGRLVRGYAKNPHRIGPFAEILPARRSDSCIEESVRNSALEFIKEEDIRRLVSVSREETNRREEEKVPKHIVHQRMRNGIMGYLEMAASREQLLDYQRDVFYADVLAELFAQWECCVHIRLMPEKTIEAAHPSPIYTDEERAAILEYHRVWDDVADRIPEGIHSIQEFVETPLWRELADAATRSLAVFQKRGRSPEK